MAIDTQGSGFLTRTWRRLTSPSARWSVLALVIIGVLLGAVGVIGTQVMVAYTGTNEFCGGRVFSWWVAGDKEERAFASRIGVQAGCPTATFPIPTPIALVQGRAGVKNVNGEIRGGTDRSSEGTRAWPSWSGRNSEAIPPTATCHVLRRRSWPSKSSRRCQGRKAANKTCRLPYGHRAHAHPWRRLPESWPPIERPGEIPEPKAGAAAHHCASARSHARTHLTSG